MVLQVGLALFILKFEIGDFRPGYLFFSAVAAASRSSSSSRARLEFVFGKLANREAMDKVFGETGFVFAFRRCRRSSSSRRSSRVLYYFGVLQFVVRITARA